MNRTTTALLAALEAVIAVAIGIAIPLVPLTALWAFSFGLAPDWLGFWRASVDVWLLGHGVDLMVQLPTAMAAATGLPGAEQPFGVTIALLGFAVLTVILGLRAGRRSALGRARMLGVAVATLVFGLLAAAATLSAGAEVARPSHLQGFLVPAAIYFIAVAAGSEWAMQRLPDENRDGLGRAVRRLIDDWPVALSSGIGAAVRGATAVVSGVVAVAAVLVASILVVQYATITGLYEALHAGALGGAALTVLQLALLPNLIVWACAWIVGPGFALGVGTSVSPAGTVLGSVPGLPLFGALPQGEPALGWLGVLVPIGLGLAAGWLASRRMPPRTPLYRHAAIAVGMGLVAGVAIGLLCWWSSGAIGPGRLSAVGPDPLLVGAIAAAEVGVAAVIGSLASWLMRRA